MKNKKYDERHGGPYDRGHADSYYRRSREPHFYLAGTGSSPKVVEADMCAYEIEAYHAGYNDNEADGDFKDYGWGGNKY